MGIDQGKYVRYTPEQVEALERLYHDCPKPSSLRRQQLIRECPILSNIDPKQIKVWFQNRRCREKQRKEAAQLQAVNRKLTAMNKLLMEENDRLQKQVSQLVYENGYFRQQTQNPGPDSIGIIAISHGCTGVAARACGLVGLEPTKIAHEISHPSISGWGRQPTVLRALSQRLSRGFNEAVNGFADDGWSMVTSDGIDDVTVSVSTVARFFSRARRRNVSPRREKRSRA
ncbi:hypothetical protein B296_00055340, partial [Ensete ventricosum]